MKLQTTFILILILICSCQLTKKKAINSSQTRTEETQKSNYASYILGFYKGINNDSISVLKETIHSHGTYKKRNNRIDYPEQTLTCRFYKSNQKVDSVNFQNPLYQRYEVYENNGFKSGTIIQDSAAYTLRTSFINIDYFTITLERDKKTILFKY